MGPPELCILSENITHFYFILQSEDQTEVCIEKGEHACRGGEKKTTYTSCCAVIPNLDLGYTKVMGSSGIADNKVKLDGRMERAHPKDAFLCRLKTHTSRMSPIVCLLKQDILINLPPH